MNYKILQKITFLVTVSIAFVPLSRAQTADSASALKGINENLQLTLPLEKILSAKETAVKETGDYITNLQGVTVNNEEYRKEIEAYWKSYQGKEVSNQKLAIFKEKFFTKFRKEGIFAFLNVDKKAKSDGEELNIKIDMPQIRSTTVETEDPELRRLFESKILSAFKSAVLPGQKVDTFALDQILDSISFNYPVELNLVIRPAGNDLVDLVIKMEADDEAKPLKFMGGLAQYNNYGLNQFGRDQALAIMSFDGLTADSSATLVAQASKGMAFARGDYEFNPRSIDGKYRLYLSHVNTRSILGGDAATTGQTTEYGVGATYLLGFQRAFVFKSLFDVSQRNSVSNLALNGVELNSISDNLFKFKLTADNQKLATKNDQLYELSYITGTDSQNGRYSKFDVNLNVQGDLYDESSDYIIKFHSIFLPSRNLDGYNRISIGGLTGVRAFTTVDGTGDMGAVITLELHQDINSTDYFGIFYDGGIVRPNLNAVTGLYNDTYTLQDIGFLLAGKLGRLSYNLALAKAIGSYDGYSTTNVESSPGNWRVNFSATYPF